MSKPAFNYPSTCKPIIFSKSLRNILFLLLLAPAISAAPLTVAYEEKANPPFVQHAGTETHASHPGITPEILRHLAQQNHLEISFKRMPWARAIKSLKNNKIDGLFHASFKIKRLSIGVYPMSEGKPDASKSIMSQRYIIYKLNDSPLTWDGQKLQHLNGHVGSIQGYSIIDKLKSLNAPVVENSNLKSNLNMLLAGRLAAVVELENMADSVINQPSNKYQNITKISQPLREKPYFLIFSHGFYQSHRDTAESLWEGIHAIKRTAFYQQLQEKYRHATR